MTVRFLQRGCDVIPACAARGSSRAAALIFVFWGRPTAAVTIVIAVLPLVALGLIEPIGSPIAARAPASGG